MGKHTFNKSTLLASKLFEHAFGENAFKHFFVWAAGLSVKKTLIMMGGTFYVYSIHALEMEYSFVDSLSRSLDRTNDRYNVDSPGF